MSLFPWKPLRLPVDLENQIEQIFSELIHEPWGRTERLASWEPEIDVYETEDAYLIEADLPGVSPQDVDVSAEEHWVTISGTRRSTSLIQSAQGVLLERRHGSFSRRIFLGHPVDAEHVTLRHQEGVFHIHLPKKKPAKEG